MHIRFIVQARLKSKRLSGKVLMNIGSKPLIHHIFDRLQLITCKNTSLRFAIPDCSEEGALADYLKNNGVDYIVGDELNVLDRFLTASQDLSDNDFIVRLTGDNPFLDHYELNRIINLLHEKSNFDLIYPYKLPLGMGFEIVSVGALRSQMKYPLSNYHLEHVTVYIKENPDYYQIHKVESYKEMPNIRLTVDYREDLETANLVFLHFNQFKNPFFCSNDIYQLHQKNKEIFSLNQEMKQRTMYDYEKQ